MKKIVALTFLGALATSITSVPASAASVTFTDGTFATTALTGLYQSDPSNTTVSEGACANCGVGGTAGLHFEADFGPNAVGNPNGSNSLPQATFGVLETLFTYNPSTQGAISSINASVDKNFSTTEGGAGIGNTFRPLIEQDGNIYLAAIQGSTVTGPTTTGYLSFSGTGLTASDFLIFNFTTGVFGTANPNFAGDPIVLGLGQNINLAANTTNFADYDNLSITLNSAVPEPSIWAMMILGFCGLGFLAYRRKQNGAALTVA
jgi:hypothetical protein